MTDEFNPHAPGPPREVHEDAAAKKMSSENDNMLHEISPFGGYAHGDYVAQCQHCRRKFFGDKRAWQCLPCAVQLVLATMKDRGAAAERERAEDAAARERSMMDPEETASQIVMPLIKLLGERNRGTRDMAVMEQDTKALNRAANAIADALRDARDAGKAEESAVWPLANDVEPTRGRWVAGNYLPDAPATTSAPQFDDDERRGWHRGECCNRYGCNGTMGLFVIGSSSGVQCSHCGYVVPGPNPNPTDEAW